MILNFPENKFTEKLTSRIRCYDINDPKIATLNFYKKKKILKTHKKIAIYINILNDLKSR